jgi:hypothetical protein
MIVLGIQIGMSPGNLKLILTVHQGTISQRILWMKTDDFYAQITVLTHNFQVKPVIGLSNMLMYYSVKKQYNERKSSSGKSLTGRGAFNGHIPSESALSLISFFSHNFRVKPVIGLDYLTRYYFDE